MISPIDALENWLEENAAVHKSPRNELAALQRYKKKSLPPLEIADELVTILDDGIAEETICEDIVINLEELRGKFKTNC